MSDTSLINYMICASMAADKRVTIEDAIFSPAANVFESGESVVFMINYMNNKAREKMGTPMQYQTLYCK
jgi:hypothetical protein